jgi:hypothetical protein
VKNYFSWLLNVHGVSNVSQVEVHTAEPLEPVPSNFEVEIAIAKLKRYKSPRSKQIPAELLKQEVKHYGLRSINSLILFGIRKNFLISGRSLLLYQFTRRVIKMTVVIILGYHCYQPHTKFYPISFS